MEQLNSHRISPAPIKTKQKKTHNKGIFNIIYGLTLLTHGAHKLNGASREIRLFQIDSRWSTTTKRWLWWVFSWCDVIVGQCSQVSRKTNTACCDLRILPTGIISMKVFPREGTVNGMRVVWFASHWWGWKMLQCYWGTENKKTFSFDYVADWMRSSRDWGSFDFFCGLRNSFGMCKQFTYWTTRLVVAVAGLKWFCESV